MIIRALSAVMVLFAVSPAFAQATWPNQQSGDYVIKDFRFASGRKVQSHQLFFDLLFPVRHSPPP